MATAFLTTATADTLAPATDFALTVFLSWWSADIPRFQYDGYWISAIDPWPEAWGNDWYDNDDVYVDYVDNGYYLYNRNYPGQGIAINITL